MKKRSAKECTTCPIEETARLIGDKWTLLIVRDLLTGKKSWSVLLASLSGISTRTLSNKLKKMEKEHLIKRALLRVSPPRVEYSLTKRGEELHTISEAMRAYGVKYTNKSKM